MGSRDPFHGVRNAVGGADRDFSSYCDLAAVVRPLKLLGS